MGGLILCFLLLQTNKLGNCLHYNDGVVETIEHAFRSCLLMRKIWNNYNDLLVKIYKHWLQGIKDGVLLGFCSNQLDIKYWNFTSNCILYEEIA